MSYINCLPLKLTFSEVTACFIFKKLLKAICFLHSRKVVHLDIKADNILIDGELHPDRSDEWIKLADLGLGYACEKSSDDVINIFVGTKAYQSPQIKEKLPYKAFEADFFALGVSLFVLLVGYLPFGETGDMGVGSQYALIADGNSE